ncbi:phospholipid carrier-dependent glycosyltransferase, partial [Candidatus Saccharibacteria bacterium]|nr:phospholipid carrier-dependent glycosyltransferase [Candidatus Saccharibacteria bacterium]
PIGLFLATFLIIAFTLSDYGVTWDEPAYFHASDLHIEWLADLRKNLLEGSPKKSLDDEIIKSAWHWDFYHVPHPPFSRILSGLTKAALFPYVDKVSAYRLAPALFFAMLATVMYLWVAEAFDRTTGLFSALALLVIPNLFGFAHFAVTDLPLAAMSFLTAYCFWKGLQNWKWSLVLGLVWGLALSTKFPALLIPIPLILWAHLHHRNAYANNIFAMIFLSLLVMLAVQPYLWHQTSIRILEFLYEGVSRGYRPETNFAVFFFNKLYFTNALPWYYPFFVLGVTIPETILVLALIGVVFLPAFRNHRPVMTLFLINALFIPGTGLLPGAVLHDGPRQLLGSLPFFVGLAAGGFFIVVR